MTKPWKTAYSAPADTRMRRGIRQRRPAFDAKLDVTIDWDRLARVLGERASSNSTGRSIVLGGIIKAKLSTPAPRWQDEEN